MFVLVKPGPACLHLEECTYVMRTRSILGWLHNSDWCKQGQEDVLVIKMSVSGAPGNIRLVVSDQHNQKDGPKLRSDSMDLSLKAGPSRKLIIDGPASVECPTRTVVPQLTVRVADTAGNPTLEGSSEASFTSCC